MDTKNIGIFLQKLRKENNLTQADIAKLCNVSAQAVSKWERGDSVPDIEILEKLSIMYKLSINELINGEKQEVYIDIEKRSTIIALTLSVLVFIVYLFPFVIATVSLEQFGFQANVAYKGYEVIFNGINGVVVYISLLVFITLVANLIFNVFLLAKVIKMSRGLYLYYMISLFFVSLFLLFGVIIGFFLPIPQALILAFMVANFILIKNYTIEPSKYSVIRKELEKRKRNDKDFSDLVIDSDLSGKRQLLFAKISTGFTIIVLLVWAVVFLGNAIDTSSFDEYFAILMLIGLSIIGNIVFFSYVLINIRLRAFAKIVKRSSIFYLLYALAFGAWFFAFSTYTSLYMWEFWMILSGLGTLGMLFIGYKMYQIGIRYE